MLENRYVIKIEREDFDQVLSWAITFKTIEEAMNQIKSQDLGKIVEIYELKLVKKGTLDFYLKEQNG